MNYLFEPLSGIESINIVKESMGVNKTLYISGAIDSQKSHLMAALAGDGVRLVVTYNELKAKEIVEDMKFFCESEVLYYPSKDLIFYSADVHSNDIERQRLEVIHSLIRGGDLVIVMSVEALLNPIIAPERFVNSIKQFSVGDTLVVEDFSKDLVQMGYERSEQTESVGQFSVRGGIIDVYPVNSEDLIRIELWGDEIDSIRTVNKTSQRTIDNIQEIEIIPAREIIISEELVKKATCNIEADRDRLIAGFSEKEKFEEADRLMKHVGRILEKVEHHGNFNGIDSFVHYYFDETFTLMDYVSHGLIFIDEPNRIKERYENIKLEFDESMGSRLEKGYVLPGQANVLHDIYEVIHKIEKHRRIILSTLHQRQELFKYSKEVDLNVKSINPYHNNFEVLRDDLNYWCNGGYKVLLLSASRTRAYRMIELLNDNNIETYLHEDEEQPLVGGKVAVSIGNVHKGFEYPQVKFVVITETEIISQKKKKRKKNRRFKEGRKIEAFADLKVGDYVVHESYGVGIFSGVENIEVEGIAKDFIKISYRDDGNLYITSNQLDVIQKYIGAEGGRPKLNKLGTNEWKKTKAKVQKAVEDLAEGLIELYAKREVAKGYYYGEDTVWQKEFEELFPYEETDDQMDAINDTKADMQSGKIMDRLICGDVGYGKTEVAIRAAFKAVQENKQVAYLVPTTILAQQHYNNFVQRMKDFPVSVDMLSRFRTPKQQKEAIKGLQTGLVDIVIGTHRLLSKDIKFRDLGLLIIDEEQRFGVKHKEKIKEFKENVDVLTLTATPIPRTLHMSLIGIRDMSILEEPPRERHPIQTYVLEHNDELIKDAILREINRGGQVYYVHNRVNNIDEVTNIVSRLVPEAVVTYAHGQMSERELENIMVDFINGDIDVLVSTTIIETGLDIQNANTMIIQDADRMGLSQLYQLRGRVGRSNRVAYAYLMYKRDKVLKEVAEKRLQAIKQFTEFGSGFKIAMRDLEIRGAGNILGASQHGHMDAVGYDMYTKLLEEAVHRQNGMPEKIKVETTVTISVDAYIPSRYIGEEIRKIEMYKKISAIENREDYEDLFDEMIDRYGDLPKAVSNLLEIALIKGLANSMMILSIEQKGDNLVFKVDSNAGLNPGGIPQLINDYNRKLQFTMGQIPYFTLNISKVAKKALLEHILIFLERLKNM